MRAPRRRQVVLLTLLYVAVSLLLLNGAGWFYYAKTARQAREIEHALDVRLTGLAEGLARRLDAFQLSVLRPGDEPHVFFQQSQRTLERARDEHACESISVLSADRRLLVSSSARHPIGAAPEPPSTDAPALAAAFSGRKSVTPVRITRGQWRKSACAPVLDGEGRAVAVVVVSASAAGLSPLRATREDLLRFLAVIAGMSVVAASVLSSVLWLTLRALLRGEETVRRAERLALAGTLAAGVAHEVRNPLGVISGMAQLLLERSRKSSREAKLAADILSEVQRVNAVVSDFLDFSRPSPARPRPVRPAAALQRSLALLRSSFERRNITVVDQVDPELPEVVVDDGRLHQVLLNLLLNAREAMEGGGTLTLGGRVASGTVELTVSDNGPGVAPEHRERLFEPFFTTKDRGTGLGLAVARRIVEEAGGELSCDPPRGRGATFRLALRRA